MDKEKLNTTVKAMQDNINKVIVGKKKVVNLMLTALIANGHVLLEDVPGTGKTLLAKTISRTLNLEFARVQFTPDLLPSDITGVNYYNPKQNEFIFRKGPVFSNLLLADEINRATPRTQSSLLESMEERQVTIDGVTYQLDAPFLVIATQNQIESAGTFPLPEAQLDRFLMQMSLGMPSLEEEINILNRFMEENPLLKLESVCSKEELLELQREAKKIYIHPDLVEYIANIVKATRENKEISIGVSPRGSLALLNAVRAYAIIMERSYVVPEDIKELAIPVLAHRLILPMGSTDGMNRTFIQEILAEVHVPTEEWERK
ncbi:AAA family ATPase [Anaeromicropila herbilytica]|uniref:ATPase n=1 Tax=Anaeromicropila herbilytica TaxID=2785025 RepID=A0A7R7EPP4_9FIRM|nr:AAA family ATPase [Anaeromicropila herbilytica]BCN32435.1 ATPase [Anaeromicropila herbilytica]